MYDPPMVPFVASIFIGVIFLILVCVEFAYCHNGSSIISALGFFELILIFVPLYLHISDISVRFLHLEETLNKNGIHIILKDFYSNREVHKLQESHTKRESLSIIFPSQDYNHKPPKVEPQSSPTKATNASVSHTNDIPKKDTPFSGTILTTYGYITFDNGEIVSVGNEKQP